MTVVYSLNGVDTFRNRSDNIIVVIKYDSFYNESFNSYFNSISERQKQLFNISTPSFNLLGAYPQVLIITPNNKENDLPQGICIYHKEYQMDHKLPNIIIDQLSSLNESNLSEFITLFIMYIKNNNKDYDSIIIKINLKGVLFMLKTSLPTVLLKGNILLPNNEINKLWI